MTCSTRAVRNPLRFLILGYATLFHLNSGALAQEEPPRPTSAARVFPLHESLAETMRAQHAQKASIVITTPANRRYVYNFAPRNLPTANTRETEFLTKQIGQFFPGSTYGQVNFGGARVDESGLITYQGKQYDVWFRYTGTSGRSENWPAATLAEMRKQFAVGLVDLIRHPMLHSFTPFQGKEMAFGVLLGGKPVTDKEREDTVLKAVKELLSGHTVEALSLSEDEELLFESEVVNVIFFKIDQGQTKWCTEDEDRELARMLRRHLFYVYRDRPEEVRETPVEVKEIPGPPLIDTTEPRGKVETARQSAADVTARLAHFEEILSFLERSHPELHGRLKGELEKLEAEFLPVNSLKGNGSGFQMSHLIAHDGRKLRIAGNKWAEMDKNNDKQVNRSYAILYGLLFGVLPQDDVNRGKKAHDLMMEIYWLEADRGLANIQRRELGALVDAFVVSGKTENLRAYVDDVKLVRERDQDFLGRLGTQGKEISELLDLLVETAERNSAASLAQDYATVLGRDVPEETPGSTTHALWRLFQTMSRDPQVARQIYEKDELLIYAMGLVFSEKIKTRGDLDEALKLLEESRRPEPDPDPEPVPQPMKLPGPVEPTGPAARKVPVSESDPTPAPPAPNGSSAPAPPATEER